MAVVEVLGDRFWGLFEKGDGHSINGTAELTALLYQSPITQGMQCLVGGHHPCQAGATNTHKCTPPCWRTGEMIKLLQPRRGQNSTAHVPPVIAKKTPFEVGGAQGAALT